MDDQVTGRDAVVLLGPPGAGKGTLARRLADERGFVHVDMGQLLRARTRVGDPVGMRILYAQRRGTMVPKELVLTTLCDHLERLASDAPLLLDGFPRTTAQVAAADDGRVPVNVTAAIWLDVPAATAAERLATRRRQETRADDDPEVVTQRLKLVGETVEAVRALYEARGLLEVIDASRSPDDVFTEAATKLGSVFVS